MSVRKSSGGASTPIEQFSRSHSGSIIAHAQPETSPPPNSPPEVSDLLRLPVQNTSLLCVEMMMEAELISQDKSLGELNARFNFLRKFSTNTKTTVFLAKVRALD